MAYDPIQGVIVSLEKLDAKLDKRLDEQDGKIDSIAVAIQRLIAVDIEIRELKDSHKRLWKHVETIEAKQMETGCATLNKFISTHDNELKHNLNRIKACEEFNGKVEARIHDIDMKPAKRVDGMITHGLSAFVGALVLYIMAKIGLSK